jgi:hypothetical protein
MFQWYPSMIQIFSNSDISKAGWWQVSLCCRVIMNFIWGHHFANSTVAIMILLAITSYDWTIYWMNCSMLFVELSFPYWLWRRVIPYGWFRLVCTADVADWQRIFPPRHLTLPCICRRVRATQQSILYLLFGLWLRITHKFISKPPSCIDLLAISFGGFSSISCHSIWVFFGSYTVFTIFDGFSTFWRECHWRDLISRNAHLVHQNWYRISFTF